ncbi:DNA polymerase sliding clamp [Halobaculum lipolyticum]|uniref:DNA polymerase sliding clamp n=1 Tax=Halobaculum lipolyticum TaxID=3032001 RepID=A0ABD5WDN2_9EURY|nr:DNA polymerase sliding clamp [Halobaculum sp. DT31]
MADADAAAESAPTADPPEQLSDVVADAPVRVRVRADTLRPLLGAVGALVEECRLTFGADGVRAAAMDPATVAAVEVELDAAATESYTADGTTVGVDVDRLDDVLAMADRDAVVTLALDPESFRLHVVAGELAYTLGLFDPESVRGPGDVEALGFEHTAALTLPGETVGRFVTAAGMVADHLTLAVDPDEGRFVASADGDTDDVRFVVPREDTAEFDAGEARSLFSLSYLECVERAVPSGTDVRVTLGEEAPLGVAYEVADGGGRVEAFVAPRLQAV